jgi:predicted enzyme involved in methoxymalonyl-ACP biosynthesis
MFLMMIAQFLIDNGRYKQEDIERLRDVIQQHLFLGNLITKYDQQGIYAVVRFDVVGNVAYIMDCVVRRDKRFQNILKELVAEGLMRFPQVKRLRFERSAKNKPMKHINIDKFK